MTRRRVVYAPEAEAQLVALHSYIATRASPDVATGYVSAIMEKCETLADFPSRGSPREDLRPGLRTIAFRRRVTIAYAADETETMIIGLFYGGQNIDTLLRED